jgi:hypothetical protein
VRKEFCAGVDVADDDDVARMVKHLSAAQRRGVVERGRRRFDCMEPRRGTSRRRFGLLARYACLAPAPALRDIVASAGKVGNKRARRVREARRLAWPHRATPLELRAR